MNKVYALLGILLTTSCAHIAPPEPNHYCPYTCASYHMDWEETTMTDPNDETRLRWCACTSGEDYRIVPPRDPDSGMDRQD